MAMNGGRMTEWRTVPAESWRDHVEQMLRTWQCRHLNEDGDRLALDDFMGQESIEDLIDFVCDAWSGPAPAPVALTDEDSPEMTAADFKRAIPAQQFFDQYFAARDQTLAAEVSRLTAERDALRAALAEFYEAWPGGLDEIESSVSEWRARAIRHEHRLTAAGIPFDNPIHPQLLADCDADGYLIDAALKDAP